MTKNLYWSADVTPATNADHVPSAPRASAVSVHELKVPRTDTAVAAGAQNLKVAPEPVRVAPIGEDMALGGMARISLNRRAAIMFPLLVILSRRLNFSHCTSCAVATL